MVLLHVLALFIPSVLYEAASNKKQVRTYINHEIELGSDSYLKTSAALYLKTLSSPAEVAHGVLHTHSLEASTGFR